MRVARVFRFCRPTEIDALQPNVTFSLHFSYFFEEETTKKNNEHFLEEKGLGHSVKVHAFTDPMQTEDKGRLPTRTSEKSLSGPIRFSFCFLAALFGRLYGFFHVQKSMRVIFSRDGRAFNMDQGNHPVSPACAR